MSSIVHVTTNSLSTEYTTLCTINVVGSILSGGVDIGNLLLNSQQTLTGDYILETNATEDIFFLATNNISLKRLNSYNFVIPALTGNYLNTVNLSGTIYEGYINWTGDNIRIASPSYPSPYVALLCAQNFHINYNNLQNIVTDSRSSVSFVTLPSLTAIRFPQLKVCSGFSVSECVNLRELELPNLEYIIGSYDANIGGYASIGLFVGIPASVAAQNITNISFPKLKYVEGAIVIGGYGATNFPSLQNIDFPNLENCTGRIEIGGTFGPFRSYINLTESGIKFPNLISSGSFGLVNLTIKTFTLPKLKRVFASSSSSSFVITECLSLTGIHMPELEYIIGGYVVTAISGSVSLSSITLPKLKYYFGNPGINLNGTGISRLTNLDIGTNTLKQYGGTSFTCNQFLTQSSVDNILKAFARLDGTDSTVAYNTGSITLAGNNSIPSYTGGVTLTANGTSFIRGGNIVSASITNHGLTTNDLVTFTGNSVGALNGTYYVTVDTPDTFQYTTPGSGGVQGGGTVTMRRTTVSTDGFRYYQLVAQRGVTITINMP